MSHGVIFNLDGTISRRRKHPCKQCGAMEECDICWDHVRDFSPFGVWHCLLCRMPKVVYGDEIRMPICDFCGWGKEGEDVVKVR